MLVWMQRLILALVFVVNDLQANAVHVEKRKMQRTQHTKLSSGEEAVSRGRPRCLVDGETRRVAFFHIPKTGTSLGTVIAHYANPDLPDEAVVPDCTKDSCHHVPTNEGQVEFQFRYPINHWFKDCFWEKPGDGPNSVDWFGHNKVSADTYEDFKGRFVGMFRDPAQRALSSFHSFATMRVSLYNIDKELDWARTIEGTAVKMLAGQQFPLEAMPDTKVTHTSKVPDIELALSRLDGFLFAGLVEHYELSVCLFHVVTGTKWGPHDVDNMRSQKKVRGGEEWDEAALHGYKDPYDTPLYLEVKKRFWDAVNKHHLTAEKCHNLCPDIDHSDFL